MDTFQILIEGYAYPGKSDAFYHASPSTVLINSNGKKVIIDPGADESQLIEALAAAGLQTSEIDIVYLTHYHPDHFLNIRLFPGKDIYDAGVIWRNDGEEEFPGSDVIPGTSIQIIATPGHSPEHSSLIIETEEYGKVCVAQDVFWWEDGKQPSEPTIAQLMNLVDPFVTDEELLKQSRKNVLSLADWIIPGHGKMFRNPNRK